MGILINRVAKWAGLASFASCSQVLAQLPAIEKGLVAVETQVIATGLNAPLAMVVPNDGTNRLFIVQQGGLVRLYKDGVLQPTPFLNVSARLNYTFDERGLLGLVLHPGFTNPSSPGYKKLYTYTTELASAGTPDFSVPMSGLPDHHNVLTEWRVPSAEGDIVDPTTRREVLRIMHPQYGHNGGGISFHPNEEYLYIGVGDGGNANDVGDGHTPDIGNAQDTTNLLGKILRIDPLHPSARPGSADLVSANGKYRIPASNPFVNGAGLDEIYVYGLRNPYRFSFDTLPGHALVVADVGQNSIEEVNYEVQAGDNLGWNRKEGSFLFNPADGSIAFDPNPSLAYRDPLFEYDHGQGSSVIGGFVYRGAELFIGGNFGASGATYIFGDFFSWGSNTGRLFYGDLETGKIQEFRLGLPSRNLAAAIKSFAQDHEKEIYVITDSGGNSGGKVLKLVGISGEPTVVNLSGRARVSDGDNVLIAGFMLAGSATKRTALRAMGPSLTVNGQPVNDRLLNPTLSLFNEQGTETKNNDNWASGEAGELQTLGLAPQFDNESGMVFETGPAALTAVVRGVGNSSGIGLVEIYDVEQTASATLLNVSVRGFVETGDNVLIGGFIVGGSQTRDIVTRGIGPSLQMAGVTNVLLDPNLQVYNSSGTLIASNDNWRDTQQSQIQDSDLAPSDNRESAIRLDLPPGAYTAIVRGVSDTIGNALVEVYYLP